MNGGIYYFSGTGNTKWVADRFNDKFKKYNIDIELISIEKLYENDINKYDFIIFGTPIHAEGVPKIFKDFVNKIPCSDKKVNCLLYCTLRTKKSAALAETRGILESKGYKVLIQDYIQMPNNNFFGFSKQPSENRIIQLTEKAEKQVEGLALSFMKGEKNIKPVFSMGTGISKVIERNFLRLLPSMSNNLTSTAECIKCGICLRNCPKGNITFEEGHAIFHSNCMMCVRCIHICPTNGIRYKGKKIKQTQRRFITEMVIR